MFVHDIQTYVSKKPLFYPFVHVHVQMKKECMVNVNVKNVIKDGVQHIHLLKKEQDTYFILNNVKDVEYRITQMIVKLGKEMEKKQMLIFKHYAEDVKIKDMHAMFQVVRR